MTNQTIVLKPGDTLTVTTPGTAPPAPGPVIPPPSPPSGSFTALPCEIDWPTAGNTHAAPRGWGANVALVIHFRTPATVGDTAILNFQNTGPPYNMRVASLSALPGVNVVTQFPVVPPIMWAACSQTPTLPLIVGDTKPGWITVQPNTDYYVTAVNRQASTGNWPGFNSCNAPDCGAGLRLDFNN